MSQTRAASLAWAAMLGLALLAAVGGCTSSLNPAEGVTRRLDQYPLLLELAGSGIIESGQTGELTIIADGLQVRANPGFVLSESFGVDVTTDPSVTVDPSRPGGTMFRRDVDLEGILRRALGRAGIVRCWRHVCAGEGADTSRSARSRPSGVARSAG